MNCRCAVISCSFVLFTQLFFDPTCAVCVGEGGDTVASPEGTPVAPPPVRHRTHVSETLDLDPILNPENGHYYAMYTDNLTWEDARSVVETLDYEGIPGHLATLTSAEENSWVHENLGSSVSGWIGGFQDPEGEEPGGGWMWVTGEYWSYANWHAGEPNEGNPDEDYVLCYEGGDWNDAMGSHLAPSIVEFSPEGARRVSAHIEPSEPRTLDNLECVVTVENATDFPDLLWLTKWFENGREILEGMEVGGEYLTPTGAVLSHHFTTKNETFYCCSRGVGGPRDILVRTSSVTIMNSTPTAPLIMISPGTPGPMESLSAVIVELSTDADGDEVRYEIRWYRSQDGGQTFVYQPDLSGIAPSGNWIPPGYLIEGDLWRVEVIPFETESPEDKGEIGWDQVYVGDNQRPVVVIDRPESSGILTCASTVVSWHSLDPDGDPVLVDLYYDTDGIEGGSTLIAEGLPEEGTMIWEPPVAPGAGLSFDLSGDGYLSAEDLFLLAGRWQADVEGTRYWIFGRAWDSKGAIGEAFSPGAIMVPEEMPGIYEVFLDLLREWRQ